MATQLPASGPLSIRDFNLGMEGTLGFSAGRATGLNDPAVRATVNKKTGPVSLSDLYGKWVSRIAKPISASSPVLSLFSGSQAGGIYDVRMIIDPGGSIVVAGYNLVGGLVTTYQTTSIPGAIGPNTLYQCYITVTRTAWNSQGSYVTTSFSQLTDTPNWSNLFIEVASVPLGGLPDATYQVDLVDRFDASNTFTFTTRLQVTA